MKVLPKVSLVTACFNSETTLADTIRSVESQTYPNIEHIFVDGGSTDSTVDILTRAHKVRPSIVKWRSEHDSGIYDAMNKGIASATGEIVGILNSDDFYTDANVISDIVKHFVDGASDVVYADLLYVDRHNTDTVTRRWVAGRGRVQLGWYPPHPTLFVAKDLYNALGNYRTDFKIASDYDFMLKVFSNPDVKVSYLPRFIVRMRTGGASTTSLASNRLVFVEALMSLREARFYFPFMVNVLRLCRKYRQLLPLRSHCNSWKS